MKRRTIKKRARRKSAELHRWFKRQRGVHYRASFKAKHGHFPGEYGSPEIGHITGCYFFSNPYVSQSHSAPAQPA